MGVEDQQVLSELAQMTQLFGLTEKTIDFLVGKIGEELFQAVAAKTLLKKPLTSTDKDQFESLCLRLKLPVAAAEKILAVEKMKIISPLVNAIAKKNRCSPEDERAVNVLMINLDASTSDFKNVDGQLKKAKYYWELEHLPLKVLAPDPNLQKSELCYFKADQVQWNEVRGSGNYKHYELINTGTLFLTNKRLYFASRSKNSIITYDKILRVGMEAKGVTIYKDKGKNPVLNFSADREAFAIIFNRIHRNGSN